MRRNAERIGEPSQRPDGRIPRAALQVADITAFHSRLQRKLFLRQAFQLAMVTDVHAKKQNHVHAAMWT